MTDTVQAKIEQEMLTRRPAEAKADWGWRLIRRAALEGGVTVWTPNLQAVREPPTGPQPGVWTTISLLGDITTYYSPGTPDSLLDSRFAKVRQTSASMTRFAAGVLTFSGTVFWVLHPASLFASGEKWLMGGEWLQMPNLAIGMLGLSSLMEIVRQFAKWRLRRWLP